MAMGTTSPDAVDISTEEALSDYTTAVKDTDTIIILLAAAEAETERSSHDYSLCCRDGPRPTKGRFTEKALRD